MPGPSPGPGQVTVSHPHEDALVTRRSPQLEEVPCLAGCTALGGGSLPALELMSATPTPRPPLHTWALQPHASADQSASAQEPDKCLTQSPGSPSLRKLRPKDRLPTLTQSHPELESSPQHPTWGSSLESWKDLRVFGTAQT